MRLPQLLLFLSAFPAPVTAQFVVGSVIEEGSDAPVSAAEVYLVDATDRERASATTDSTGWFQVTAPKAGRYAVRVRHVGFASFTSDPLDVGPSQTLELQIRLGIEAVPLQPLVVTASSTALDRLNGFRERLATNAFGRFVTRTDIDRRPAARVTDFFRTMGFVYVVPVKRGANPSGMTADLIMMRGRGNEEAPEGVDRRTRGLCEPALFLDGVRIRQSAFHPIDDLLRPGVLEGIEVYIRFSDAPVQFQTETTCGVVALWTREGGGGGGSRGWLRWAAGVGFFGGILAFVAR